MKKIYFFLILIAGFSFNPLKAQLTVDTTGLMEAYLQSEYIFEGVVVSQCTYEDGGNNIYTTNIIQISKIVKGNLTCGTVAIVTMGGTNDDGSNLTVDHQIQYNVGVVGMFMCNNITYPYTACDATPTNAQPLMLTYGEYGSFEYLFDLVNNEVVGFNSQFPTLQSFYEFLVAIGINIVNCNASIIENIQAQKNIKFIPNTNIVVRKPQKQSEADKKILSNKRALNQAFSVAHGTNLNKAGETIEYLITKASLSGSGSNQFYDIDISVKSNVNTTYLDGVSFRLKYNPSTFGTNINSTITKTLSSSLTSYYNYLSSYDFNDSILQVTISGFSSVPNRVLLTNANLKIINIQIPVTNCKYFPNIKIDTFDNARLFTIFALASNTPSSGPYSLYSNYITGAFRKGVVCDPIVTSISPDSIAGGIKAQYTIYGNYFGDIKGKVYMTPADITDSSFIALDKYDYTWSDNQIVVTIPAFADSAYYDGGTYKKGTVGSGNIKIVDAYGNIYIPVSSPSEPSKIQVKYVVWNQSKGVGTSRYKNNEFLYSANSDGKYHFKLASNITDAGMINCIKAAFRRWSCTTGVSFILDAGTSNNGIDSDGVNIITLATYPSGSQQIATAFIRSSLSCSTSPTVSFPTAELDITINNAYINDFQYDTTGNNNINAGKYDFFSIILHELGHCHLLGHVNNPQDLMYRAQTLGAFNAVYRKLNFTGYKLQAGDYVVANSQIASNGISCQYNLPISIQPINCRNTTLGIASKMQLSDNIIIYPNPFQDLIQFDFNSKTKQTCEITIYDKLGQSVYIGNREVFKGENYFTISELGLKDGIYFVTVKTENKTFSIKMICIR